MDQPWGVSAPQFLAVYVAGFAVALALTTALRRVIAGRGPRTLPQGLDVSMLAYLAGGYARVVKTAVFGLLQTGLVGADRRRRLTARGDRRKVGDPVQRAVLDSLRRCGTTNFGRLQSVAEQAPQVQRVHQECVRLGLAVPPKRRRAALLALVPLVAVTGVGTARLVNGVHLGRPVGLLAVLLLLSVLTTLIIARVPPRTTGAGRKALREARARSASGASVRSAQSGGPALEVTALGVALLGAAAVSDPHLRTVVFGSPSGGSSGGSSGGCGGGGGGCGG